MKQENKYLVIISGATATGKSEVAVQLAKHLGTEVISADSRQLYKELGIGVAKPTRLQLEKVHHHLISEVSIYEYFTVDHFVKRCTELLQRIFKKTNVAILCGGTGFYINALCNGLDDFPPVTEEDVSYWETRLQTEGITNLQEELERVDPDYFNVVDQHNPMRLIRALSVHRSSGQPYSSFLGRKKQNALFFSPIFIQIDLPRETLYEKINSRVDQMVQDGLVEEARELFKSMPLRALQTVGYQELFRHFQGELTMEEAIDLIKRNSRRYAKRQLTWLRNQGEWNIFRPNEMDEIMEFIKSQIGNI